MTTPESTNAATTKPGKPGMPNRFGPLSEQETNELVRAAERTPALGRLLLTMVRNRNAKVFVPETPLGEQMFSLIGEYDRLASRAERALARSMSLDGLKAKNELQEKALGLIEPMAELTVDLAVRFDNPKNPIIRHPLTKKKLQARKERKEATPESQSIGSADEAVQS